LSAFRIHAWAFCAGTTALALANWLGGGPWWSFWPIAAWGVVFGVHYLVHKARTADERWVEERTADLRSKSYDASHIDSIAERYEEPKVK
jgi:2TM domain